MKFAARNRGPGDLKDRSVLYPQPFCQTAAGRPPNPHAARHARHPEYLGDSAPRPTRLEAEDHRYAAEQTDCEDLLSLLNILEERNEIVRTGCGRVDCGPKMEQKQRPCDLQGKQGRS